MDCQVIGSSWLKIARSIQRIRLDCFHPETPVAKQLPHMCRIDVAKEKVEGEYQRSRGVATGSLRVSSCNFFGGPRLFALVGLIDLYFRRPMCQDRCRLGQGRG